MTEEQKDQQEAEESVVQEDLEPAEAEDAVSAEEPVEGSRTGWTVVVGVIAAILVLCTLVVCVTAAIVALSGGKDETPVPAPTTAPVPTQAPSGAMIVITESDQGRAIEVTPEGEIVRMGSLGSLGEWWCGDGPGPSLRGIVRGPVPPCGGLGIFTRVATKVYHWAGPAEFPIEGVSPNYAPSEMPTNFQYRFYTFPSIDKMVEAQTKLGESEIAFEIMGFNVFMVAANIATSSPEMEELYDKLKKQSLEGPGFQVILIGNSIGEFEYSKKVLQQIIDETGGKSMEALEDPKYAGGMIWRCIRI